MAGAIGFSSFYGNSGHIRWLIVSWDTIVNANTVRMILNQVGLNCSCSRGDFVTSLHQTLERQVMTEAHRKPLASGAKHGIAKFKNKRYNVSRTGHTHIFKSNQ